MNITLNGSPYETDGPVFLEGLLQRIGLEGKPVVIELNEVAVFQRDYPTTAVEEGARIEVVTLAAGG